MGAAKTVQDFEIHRESQYILVRLFGQLEGNSFNEFETQTPDIHKLNVHVIFDCELLTSVSLPWLRTLVRLQVELQANGKDVRMVNVHPTVSRFIKQEGVEKSLRLTPTLRTAQLELGLIHMAKVLDVNFINPFLDATLITLEKQALTKATPGKPYRSEKGQKYQGDISGVIGLISNAFSGSVVISFPAATFLKIMSRMIGEDCKEINKEIEDGAGELTNIIFGQAKVILNERGFGVHTALPSVVSGAEHSVLQVSAGPRMIIPFESDAGPFFVEICLSA